MFRIERVRVFSGSEHEEVSGALLVHLDQQFLYAIARPGPVIS